MLGPLARISNQAGRNVMRSFVRNGSHGGVPGENLPFDIHNRTRLTINFFWFVGTGLAAPFVVLWHQMNKNST
uniref:Cytochrome c oxidase subunit 7C, mitochondrial n=1 Tax=Heliothis virescens TaxID=7102 RepID=A0A2A4ITU1_HELVI